MAGRTMAKKRMVILRGKLVDVKFVRCVNECVSWKFEQAVL
jgi:hypothetical protein